ncbi:MAG: nucleoside deaminase [Hyphomicrobiaceae bacterium]|nr:nucleoside deaminase [Hyphomicrobiaceae bacterium]
MQIALKEAKAAQARGEVPVGAVIVSAAGEVLAQAGNRTLEFKDPSAHAEIVAIREACQRLDSERLIDCDLYVTLEPCTMCAGLISFARIRRLYFAAYDEKSGGIEQGAAFFAQKTCHHTPETYGGIMESDAARLLCDFFRAKR